MQEPDTIFFDGHCGLCHRWVKFVLRHDRDGSRFRFAPRQGSTFAEAVPPETREALPDSVIVQTGDGQLKTKSAAVLHILRRLGGGWALLGGLGSIVPGCVRDFFYDRVAAVRHRLFKKPNEACPLMPMELRGRFLP